MWPLIMAALASACIKVGRHKNVFPDLKYEPNFMKRLFGKRGDHQYDPQTILYLIGNINYCYLHLVSGEVILSCRTLKWFSDQWPDFLRVHKKALINPIHVSSCKLAPNSKAATYIIMANKIELEVARRRVPAVVESLAQLAKSS